MIRIVRNPSPRQRPRVYAPQPGQSYHIHGPLHQGPQPNIEEWGAEHVKVPVLVLCAEEFQPDIDYFPYVSEVIYAPYDDGRLSQKEANLALSAARHVAYHLLKDRDVLVTCHMGWNRSGLVSALALMRAYQMGSKEAIETVKRGRGSSALSNQSFCMFLYEAEKKGWGR